MPQPNGNLRAEIQELTVEIAVLRTRLDTSETALRMQAAEYERRLEALNNAHSRAEVVQKQYVTRELHDQLYVELSSRIEKLKTEIDTSRGRSVAIAAIFAGLVAIAGLLMTAYHVFLESTK